MRSFVFFVGFFFFVIAAQAKVLLISDVDDTLKHANVLNPSGVARYAFDTTSRFTGMSELYNLLLQDQTEIEFVYLSAAPSYVMGRSHRAFLANAEFPQGDYFPRDWGSVESHKLHKIREIINQRRPKQVILVGDNGNSDTEIYAQIVQEYSDWGIEFYQFIRVAYSTESTAEIGKPVLPDQVGYVTPIEIALVLHKNQILKGSSLEWIFNNTIPAILAEPKDDRGRGSLTFPSYINCRQYKWRWDEYRGVHPFIADLDTRINGRCFLNL